MEAKIKPCQPCKDTIAARQQDEMYGKGQRVHNPTTTKTGDGVKYRCTICSSVK